MAKARQGVEPGTSRTLSENHTLDQPATKMLPSESSHFGTHCWWLIKFG